PQGKNKPRPSAGNTRPGVRDNQAGPARMPSRQLHFTWDRPTGEGSQSMSAVEATEVRRQRGLAIAAICKITEKNGYWTVPSQTGNGSYRVILNPQNPFVPQCTCKDYEERKQPCKHV